jgi:hypothetical protein
MLKKVHYTVKKAIDFPVSPTKLSLPGNNLITPGQGDFGWLHPWGREKR